MSCIQQDPHYWSFYAKIWEQTSSFIFTTSLKLVTIGTAAFEFYAQHPSSSPEEKLQGI